MKHRPTKVALVGNPNVGKSSIFNQLSGLTQQVANYPGSTVERKAGKFRLAPGYELMLQDLPGTYSLTPRSEEERLVSELLTDPEHKDFPDLVIVVADATNLERNLLLLSQVAELNIPLILALNMMDLARKQEILIDEALLSKALGDMPVIKVNARRGEGIAELKQYILAYDALEPPVAEHALRIDLSDAASEVEKTELRYAQIRQLLKRVVKRPFAPSRSMQRFLDKLFTHKLWGYMVFTFLLMLIFQSIYAFAELPMALIDEVFLWLSQQIQEYLPTGPLTRLLAEGIIPGLGGVIIFIPQILLLFLFILFLEESGYMARVVFIMDRLMRPLGLSGKSVVPMISGLACAVPAIMATRTIANLKERLVTIMVTPLMSCAARLPVYTLLIALVIPDERLWGVWNLKGLVLLGLYLLGMFAALLTAWVIKRFIKSEEKEFLMMELPSYKLPRIRVLMIHLWDKVKAFTWDAGKIIFTMSIVLWVLGAYGPADREEMVAHQLQQPSEQDPVAIAAYENERNSLLLEYSWLGIMGKKIEPVIAPLGYDWKIGIALISSFAAREVFVGCMATIYSVGEDFEEDDSLLTRMKQERNPRTGLPVYTLATGLSLMIFYAFAMQCMSTLAIVYRETQSWKWPLIQLVYMTGLAYLCAWAVYQFLS